MPTMATRPVRALRPSALLACAAGALLSCAASAQVQWRTGADSAIPTLSAEQIRTTLTDLNARAADTGGRRVVVQFKAPVDDAQRARLANAGMTLLSPLGDNAFFASISPVAGALDAAAIAAEPALYSVREVRDQWKLDPFLQADMVPEWAVVNMKERKDGAEGFEPVFGAYVTFHKDVDLATEAAALAKRYGAFVRSALGPVNALVIEIPQSQVKLLAAEDAVQWIEPAIWQLSTMNASNRERTGVNTLQAAPYGLTGAGVSVMVFDGGTIRTTHQDFQGRATNRDTDGVSDHATHVSGTIGGAGVANALHKGMAPGVTLNNYGFEWSSGSDFLYTNPGDLLQDYTDAITNHGVSVANNSIGNNTAPNGNPCDWQGNYGTTDMLIDEIARGSIAGKELIIVWAAGNERQSSACQNDGPAPGSGYATAAPPAGAKNHITVGAMNSNDDSVTSFTSWGPTDDGRMKPDVSGPGSQNGSHAGTNDNGVTSSSSSSDTSYNVKSGTSMAAPTVTGIVALMLQDFRVQFSGEPDPIGSTIKAILAHTAVDLTNTGPDYKTGYGSVRADAAVDQMRTGNFVEESVPQGGVYSALVLVNPGETFKATLAWNDPAATLNAVPALINNLDLRVFDPNGVRRYPWTLNPAVPSAAAVRTAPNTLDNIEQVAVGVNGEPVPAGVWRVEVVGTNVPVGPQKFSLTASPFLINCSTAGVAGLDRSLYSCSDTMLNASVTDCDLNTNDNAVETVMVLVTSTTDPVGEIVVLTETGAQTADFRGPLPLSTSNAAGSLQIGHGDTISFTYIDADDGFGNLNVPVTATAMVDCVGPIITNVQVSNIGPFAATVTFTTSEPATSSVSFGTSCAGASTTVSAPGLNTSHSINLAGLSEDTSYFFTVAASDAAGNGASNNNGGACFTFSTSDIPSYFTENFDTTDNRDTAGHMMTFTPNNTIDFYRGCFEPITALPTDPAGGNIITFPSTQDDQFVQITPGATVSLYGASYTTFFVGSNGYVTFTAGDTDYTETIADHFDLPRISGHFDDLHPGNGGQVSWKTLADRVAVTYLNVPEYSNTGANTFQIEMFFDGVVRISCMNMSALDGITGISAGGGTPVGFVELDLSTMNSCATCFGDIDGDGDVDFSDLNLLLGSYGTSGANLPGDLDGDGDVDFNDLNAILGVYGTNC